MTVKNKQSPRETLDIKMFKTVPASGTVSISQSPPNVVNKGSDVELHCASSSLYTRSINWIRNKQTVSFSSSLRLSSVTDEDGGLYVCKVLYEDSTTVMKEWNLNIKCKSFVDTGNQYGLDCSQSASPCGSAPCVSVCYSICMRSPA